MFWENLKFEIKFAIKRLKDVWSEFKTKRGK